jgi:hypothetical protein
MFDLIQPYYGPLVSADKGAVSEFTHPVMGRGVGSNVLEIAPIYLQG